MAKYHRHDPDFETYVVSGDGTGRKLPLFSFHFSQKSDPRIALDTAQITRWAVRRLTPLECERLQGFPDDWTLVPVRNRMAADGSRYKQIGNSMAVNVIRWLGQRFKMVETCAWNGAL
jgi:site-specific DNA-cytosine methylase